MTVGYLTIANPEALSRIFILIAAFLFLISCLIIIFILLSRVIKDSRQKRASSYLSILQPSLNGLLFHEGEIPIASYEFNLNAIKNVIDVSRLARQTLINHIVSLKKNISGASATLLETVYQDLGLDQHSTKKLSSYLWSRRVQGIRELSELNSNKALNHILKLDSTQNMTLREELLLSTIRLDLQNPLEFLDKWDCEITAWMRIHIYHYLSHIDSRMIPDFSKWFSSSRDDVVIFAISMARQFQQTNTTPGLVRLLVHKNHTIVASTIRALTELEAFTVIDDVIGIADRYWSNEKVSKAIVIYVGKTGHLPGHFALLSKYLKHEALSVKLQAVMALRLLDGYGYALLAQHNDIQALIAHASEPLLQ